MILWIVEVGEPVPELDGPARPFRCAMLTQEATNAGHDVVRWTSSFSHYERRMRPTREECRSYGDRLQVRLLYGPGYAVSRSPWRLWHHRIEASSFFRQARELSPPDLIFCVLPTPQLCRAAAAYGRAAGVPVVIDIQDVWPLSYLKLFPVAWRPRLNFLLAWEYHKLRGCLRPSVGITAISNTFLDWALGHARRPAGPADGVFPIGYPAAGDDPEEEREIRSAGVALKERLGLKEGEFVVAFVGTLVSSYDFTTVLAAAQHLERVGKPVRFVFAGSGGHLAEIQRLAASLKSVTLLGWLGEQHELKALLQLADAGLAPYRRGCTMSLPNKPFEYMAAGLPQISSLAGEMAAIIDRERIGLNYVPDDSRDLCRCVLRLMDNHGERRQQGENARGLFLREYSSSVIYPKLVRHLASVAGSAGARARRSAPGRHS